MKAKDEDLAEQEEESNDATKSPQGDKIAEYEEDDNDNDDDDILAALDGRQNP